MIAYVVGALLLAFIAYQSFTPERRRRWLARMNSSSPSDVGNGDPNVPFDLDAPTDHHHHHHGGDFGGGDAGHHGDHGGHHGGDFDIGGGFDGGGGHH